MGFSRELKADVDGLAKELKTGVENIAGEVRESLSDIRDVAQRMSQGADEVEAALENAPDEADVEGRRVSWKLVLGAVAGIALIGAAVMVARRRALPMNMLQRGLREGSKYAVLIPVGLQKARDTAEDLTREAAHQWDKLPRLQVKLK
jgi:hypothetical protein